MREIVDDFAIAGFDSGHADLTVSVLATKALPAGRSGDATQPGEKISECDSVQGEAKFWTGFRRHLWKVEQEFPIPIRTDDGAVGLISDRAREGGNGRFESARFGMRTNRAANAQLLRAFERRKKRSGRVTDPDGIRRKLVEEKPPIAGPSPIRRAG